jgi:hypothetical protein
MNTDRREFGMTTGRKPRTRKRAAATVEPEAVGTEVEKIIDAPSAEKMSLHESVEAQLDAEKIEAWRPDKLDPHRIIGDVLDIGLAVSVGGATCPIVLTVNTREAGLRRIWAWHQVLLRELIEARPQVGDTIGLAYSGRSKSAGGREYIKYSVAVAREADSGPQEIDYHRLAIEAASESEFVQDEEPRVEQPAVTGGAALGPDDDMPFAPTFA